MAGEHRFPDLRRFVLTWRETGPLLDEERFRRLMELDDDGARRMTLDLLSMRASGEAGDRGEGLLLHRQAFDCWTARHGGPVREK